MRKKILIVCDWFFPGFRAGGPIQSLVNFIHTFSDKYDISIITSNTDWGETQGYADIAANQWLNLYNIRIFYFSKEHFSFQNLKKTILAEEYDYLYLNSMYSVSYTLMPLWIVNGKSKGQTVIAPRGMLMEGAMRVKYAKKRFFLFLFKLFGIDKKIIWQATDTQEVSDIQHYFGEKAKIHQVSNLPKSVPNAYQNPPKNSGEAIFMFASRISVKKQLDFFLSQLTAIKGNVRIEIYGQSEDEEYLNLCKEKAAALPKNIQVDFKGAVTQAELSKVYANVHFGFLPTLGENFGHAVFDGFAAAKPMIISDKTPWLSLASQKIGWDIPLENPAKWQEIIQFCVDMPQNVYDEWAENAWQFARNFAKQPELVADYYRLFS